MLLLLKFCTFTCLCVHTHTRHGTRVAVRTSDRSRFSPPCGFWGSNSAFRAWPQLPYQLNHLTSPWSALKCICPFLPSHVPLSRAAGEELTLLCPAGNRSQATTVSDLLPGSLQVLILSSDLCPFGLRTTIKACSLAHIQTVNRPTCPLVLQQSPRAGNSSKPDSDWLTTGTAESNTEVLAEFVSLYLKCSPPPGPCVEGLVLFCGSSHWNVTGSWGLYPHLWINPQTNP